MAILLEPDDAHAYYFRGNAKGHLNQYAAAIVDYTEAIRLNPDFAHAYLYRGLAKSRLGRTREAKQDLWTAWELAVQAGDANLKALIEEFLRLVE